MQKVGKILVVDDDREMTSLLNDFLSNQGYSVVTTGSVAAALDKVANATASNRFALVVSDVRLGGKSGLDLLAALREREPILPIILFSVFSSPEMEREALAKGARAFLRKPFRLQEMASAIKKHIG